MPLKRKYIDDAAAHSGDETSDGGSFDGSGSETDDSMVCGDDEVEFEEGADPNFHQRDLSEKVIKKHRKTMLEARKKREAENDLLQLKESVIDAERQSSDAAAKKEASKSARLIAAPTPALPRSTKPRLASPEIDGDLKKQDEPKLASNKFLHESAIPPKPLTLGMKHSKLGVTKKINFRMFFTNGAMFYKFLLPIASAVHELRFNLMSTLEFTGIRLEAHDTYLTLANKSRYECDLEAGVSLDGAPLSNEDLTGLSFCVPASSFMQTLGCATLKDTVLTITKYADSPDKVTFESVTNENDVQTVYSCDLLAESRLESLKGMQFNLGYHVNLYLKTLKEQTVNAKKCGASTIYFALYQAEDEDDAAVVHSRLSVGFKGNVTSGCHDFYQSARKIERDDDGSKVIEWEPLASLTHSQRQGIQMKQCSYNEYDNSKLRLFLNHMVRTKSIVVTVRTLSHYNPAHLRRRISSGYSFICATMAHKNLLLWNAKLVERIQSTQSLWLPKWMQMEIKSFLIRLTLFQSIR